MPLLSEVGIICSQTLHLARRRHGFTIFVHLYSWLVVSTPLKKSSQMGLLFPIHGKYMQCSKPPTSFRDVLRCDNSCRAIVIRLVIKLSYIYQYVDLVKLVFFWKRRHSEAQAIFACPRRVIRWKSTGRLYHY